MRPIGLVLHGLSAMFVYGEIVGARLFVATLSLIVLTAVALGALIALRFTDQIVYAAALLVIVLLQAVVISLVAVFNVIGSRVNVTFLPIRDCPYFVAGVECVFLHNSQPEIGQPTLGVGSHGSTAARAAG